MPFVAIGACGLICQQQEEVQNCVVGVRDAFLAEGESAEGFVAVGKAGSYRGLVVHLELVKQSLEGPPQFILISVQKSVVLKRVLAVVFSDFEVLRVGLCSEAGLRGDQVLAQGGDLALSLQFVI